MTEQSHTGNGFFASASYINNVGAITPDNWLITPAVNLTGEATLSFWVAGLDASYSEENFTVYISTNGYNDFSSALVSSTATSVYTQYTVDLSAYAGQTVYIAFRHHNTFDMYWLALDDVEIYTYSTGGSTGGGTPGENGNPDNIVDGEYGAP